MERSSPVESPRTPQEPLEIVEPKLEVGGVDPRPDRATPTGPAIVVFLAGVSTDPTIERRPRFMMAHPPDGGRRRSRSRPPHERHVQQLRSLLFRAVPS